MTLIIFMMILCALFDDHDNKPRKKTRKSYRKYKKDDSWLDNAWFHDHGQSI